MKVFYHDDLDGHCAANLIYRYIFERNSWDDFIKVKNMKYQETNSIDGGDYKNKFPFSTIKEDELIFLFGDVISEDDLEKLKEITNKIEYFKEECISSKVFTLLENKIDLRLETFFLKMEGNYELVENDYFWQGEYLNYIDIIEDIVLDNNIYQDFSFKIYYALMSESNTFPAPVWKKLNKYKTLKELESVGEKIINFEKNRVGIKQIGFFPLKEIISKNVLEEI